MTLKELLHPKNDPFWSQFYFDHIFISLGLSWHQNMSPDQFIFTRFHRFSSHMVTKSLERVRNRCKTWIFIFWRRRRRRWLAAPSCGHKNLNGKKSSELFHDRSDYWWNKVSIFLINGMHILLFQRTTFLVSTHTSWATLSLQTWRTCLPAWATLPLRKKGHQENPIKWRKKNPTGKQLQVIPLPNHLPHSIRFSNILRG